MGEPLSEGSDTQVLLCDVRCMHVERMVTSFLVLPEEFWSRSSLRTLTIAAEIVHIYLYYSWGWPCLFTYLCLPVEPILSCLSAKFSG